MALISTDLLKKHVRADDFTADDEYLEFLLDAAEEYVVTACNRTSAELKELGDGSSWPKTLQQAALLIAGHWYNQREAVASTTMSEVPYTLQALIKPWRKLVDDDDDEDDDSEDDSTEETTEEDTSEDTDEVTDDDDTTTEEDTE